MIGNRITVWAKHVTIPALLTGTLALAGCSQGYSHNRPGTTIFQPGDTGLQSRDLVDMTNRLTADLLQIPEIARNPNKVIIVMGRLDNKTSTPWQNNEIYLARMRALLNQYARDRIAFVLPPRQAEHLQQEYLGGPANTLNTQTGTWQNSTIRPQYVLTGTFYDLPNAATTYYLCTFQLEDLATSQIIWENKYETRTLNLY